MILVRTKTATYVAGHWYGPGAEIYVDEKHFSEEVHERIAPPAEPQHEDGEAHHEG